MEIVLSIAGSDPSAGAGIQQDLKTITHMGSYGATVITALTSQNTQGVQGVMPVPPEVVSSQLRSLLDDLDIRAIKIGQIPTQAVAQAVVSLLGSYLAKRPLPVVYDPVMISTSGTPLMQSECIEYVSDALFPLCTLITPNLPEAESLTGLRLTTTETIMEAGKQLTSRYRTAFLLKGGHAETLDMTDHLFTAEGTHHSFTTPKIASKNLHGTGCTLSSAIATALAQGNSLPDSVSIAKNLVTEAIRGGSTLHIGNGNGPIMV
jgi:hydroxymethylpyrimidine/phosphomethylpyrimidine kinase